MNRLFLILTLLVAQSIPVTAESRDQDLDRWMEKELVPHVREQLLQHPRFKGQTVMFVVLDDNAPAAVTNALALALRDRLLDAAIRTPGVAVAWQQGQRTPAGSGATQDCEREAVHYYIGIELQQELDSSYSVKVRALDLDDRRWVAGFGRSWRGELRTIQRQAFRQSRTDMTFRGSREVPFASTEADLLARHLAHQLSCSVFRDTSGRYVIAADGSADGAGALPAAVELAGQNLVRHSAADLPARPGEHNAVLRGKAHRIAGGLFEYWLTMTPVSEDSGLSTLSTSAYVRLPDTPAPAGNEILDARDPPAFDVRSDMRLLGPLRITRPDGLAACAAGHRAGSSRPASGCSILETMPETDAIVFLLAHQAHHGLVRLGGAACRERTAARVGLAGATIRMPIPRVFGAGDLAEASAWRAEPDVDVYYALATTDASAARALANHIDRLPLKCDDRLRPGLEGDALDAWLEGLSALASGAPGGVDWRGLEVRDVL